MRFMLARKALLFIISVAMIIGGLYGLGFELFLAHIIYFKLVIGAAIVTTLGAYLLWADFISPLFGIETEG
jgi:hypothetical protein